MLLILLLPLAHAEFICSLVSDLKTPDAGSESVSFDMTDVGATLPCEVALFYSDDEVNINKSSAVCGNVIFESSRSGDRSRRSHAGAMDPIQEDFCKSSVFAATGFTFSICLRVTFLVHFDATLVIDTLHSEIVSASIVERSNSISTLDGDLAGELIDKCNITSSSTTNTVTRTTTEATTAAITTKAAVTPTTASRTETTTKPAITNVTGTKAQTPTKAAILATTGAGVAATTKGAIAADEAAVLPIECPGGGHQPVDTSLTWPKACHDREGNSYSEWSVLMSCCGCLRLTCSLGSLGFSWLPSPSPHCCQTCNGTMVEVGTTISTSYTVDQCGTTITSLCSIIDEEGSAAITQHLTFSQCCVDGAGLAPIGKSHLDPTTCSSRTCRRGQGQLKASWVLDHQGAGCGCCEHLGSLVEEGGQVVGYPDTLTCCDGNMMVKQN